MRTCSLFTLATLGAVLVFAAPARALDPTQGAAPVLNLDPSQPLRPVDDTADAFRRGAEYYNGGDLDAAFAAFTEAAEQGHAVAQWKVGKMYADGEGIPEDDYKAFQMFSQIADAHAEDNPYSPVARVVADAFVNLGNYYKDGIADSIIKPDFSRALDLFTHAATYFGDADAQYQLARMYLDGSGVTPDASRAARWLNLAARKNHVGAQATLGDMLIYGHGVRAMPIEGYMWLQVAKQNATPSQRDWVLSLEHRARTVLSEEQQQTAAQMADQWLQQRSRS